MATSPLAVGAVAALNVSLSNFVLFALGAISMGGVLLGPLRLGGVTFGVYTMIVGSLLILVGIRRRRDGALL